jgi:phosphatidylglycerophosphatase A
LSRLAPARLISSCLGCGYLRPAPGTIGSAFGLVIFVLLLAEQPLVVQIGATVVAAAVGTWAATTTSRQLGDGDPSEVVVDELAGMWVAMLGTTTLEQWVVAFFAFRLFDIWKPFPANVAESLPEGWGIMADDLVAGAYALALVWVLDWWQLI